jgi:L-Ala-D/L-Glu epimerase
MKAELHRLQLRETFRIAHGASTERSVIRGEWRGLQAEAPLVPYYGESAEQVLAELERVESIEQHRWEGGETRAARLIVDVLRHRHVARTAGCELWQHLGLPDPKARREVRSLSIPETLEALQAQVLERGECYGTLKLKLGSGNVEFDEAIVAKAREAAPKHEFIADVNGGWSPSEAAKMSVKLARWDLAMIEQPVTHKHGLEPWKEMSSAMTSRPIPIFADESAQTVDDLPGLADWVQGVNVKVLKTAGISGALAAVNLAKQLKLSVMIGCMIESELGILPALQLSALGTWADLDGPLYLAED